MATNREMAEVMQIEVCLSHKFMKATAELKWTIILISSQKQKNMAQICAGKW